MPARAAAARRALTVAAHEYRLLKQDPQSLIVLIAMPILVVVFLRGAFVAQLAEEGYGTANGSEQLVPGMVVTFSFFLIGFLGLSFFRERYWGTWQRLRATEMRRSELVLGKMIPPLTLGMAQAVVLFGLGITVFDLRVRGSFVALWLISLLLLATVASIGMFLVTVAKGFQQLNGFANVAALLLAGAGGALAPLRELPNGFGRQRPRVRPIGR